MDRDEEIAEKFFQEAWEDIEHAMCILDENDCFVKLNTAFERMLGYSARELIGKNYTVVSQPRNVGHHLSNMEDLKSGITLNFRTEVYLVHKNGHNIPSRVIVRRFPRNQSINAVLFNVEAPLATATRPELDEMEKQIKETQQNLQDQIDKIVKDGVKVRIENTGRDNITTTNSDKMIRYLAFAVIALGAVVAYVIYADRQSDSERDIRPPVIITPE